MNLSIAPIKSAGAGLLAAISASFCCITPVLSFIAGAGSKAFIEFDHLKEYHKQLINKKYKFNAPSLEKVPWNALCMEVIDPFENRLLFSKALELW